MKTLALSLLLLAGSLTTKAQQVPSLKKSLPQPSFKVFPNSVSPKLQLKTDTVDYSASSFKIKNNMPVDEVLGLLKNPAQQNLNNMPIARLQGRSKMPVVQTDQTGYTMPIAGKNVSGVYYMKHDTTAVANP